jgi:hypothetical protein
MSTIHGTEREWDFWTHGAAAVVEFPNRAAEIRHNTFGTEVRQRENTENWLHLALPSPVIADKKDVYLIYVFLKGVTNENARVDFITVEDERILFQKTVSLIDETFNEKIRVNPAGPAPDLRSGITFSIRVKFLSGLPIGAVVLGSAGMRLEISTGGDSDKL